MILRESPVATSRQTTETLALDHDTGAHIADLAAQGSTVDIVAYEDQDYHFYLLKVTSEGVEEQDEPLTDDYSLHYRSGSAVLKGYFFFRENITGDILLTPIALQWFMLPLYAISAVKFQ